MRVWLALAALGLTACTHVVQWGDTKVVTTTPNASEVARDQAARVLAPTGVLRVGVYAGSPTSLVRIEGRPSGVAHDLGFALGQALGVPVLITEFPRVAEVVRALQAQQIDFTFTNASAERARWVDFSPTLLRLELGYLVRADSSALGMADLDRQGVRIGVSQGSSSQAALMSRLQHATLVPQASLAAAHAALTSGQLEAFATNKAILFELLDRLPQHRVLDGSWGQENLAMAVPKGRQSAMPWLQAWAEAFQHSGELARVVQRSGLRGVANER